MNNAGPAWGVWIKDKQYDYESIVFDEGTITLEPRPVYCDRGNWIAKLFPESGGDLALSIDHADMWPRYYFDYESAKSEIMAWIMKRNLL